jgi:hypothetical protein
MILNVEQTIIDYLNKFGFLFENDSLLLLEDLKTEDKKNKIKEKYKKKRKALDNQKDGALKNLDDFSKSFGHGLADKANEEITEKVAKQKHRIKKLWFLKRAYLNGQEVRELEKITTLHKKSAIIISGVAFASMVIYTSYQIYRDTNSKYKKICGNKKGIEKDRCILQNRIKALKNKLDFLNGATIKCNKTKDPVKCKDKLDEEILKTREKLKQKLLDFKELVTKQKQIGY